MQPMIRVLRPPCLHHRGRATRILIQPKDTVILTYKPRVELVNFGIATFFIQGIQRLFNR